MAKILAVMTMIAEYAEDTWPSDDLWQSQLPEWLTHTFRDYTQEELKAIIEDKSTWHTLPWTFGSWLDRMRDRDWNWWSYKVIDDTVTINVIINDLPTSIKALEHLIEAAGGKLV